MSATTSTGLKRSLLFAALIPLMAQAQVPQPDAGSLLRDQQQWT